MSAPFDLERMNGTQQEWLDFIGRLSPVALYELQDQLRALVRHPSAAHYKVLAGMRHQQVVDESERRWCAFYNHHPISK